MKVFRSPLRRAHALISLCALLILSILPIPAMAQAGTEPASSAQVIAQGVDTFSRGDLVWRVIEAEAAPGDEARFGRRGRGFTLAAGEPVIVTSVTTGQNTYLSEGQAHFTAQGQNERRASHTSRASAYLGIELVAENSALANQDAPSIAFTGESFSSPRGDYNVQLTRSVALRGEEASFSPEDDAPFLVIVTEGAIQVSPGDATPVELDEGGHAEFTGDIEILASATEGATWLIASIGAEVEIPPIPTAEPSNETGSLEILLERCPDGFDAPCEPTTNDDVTVPAFRNIDDENWIIPDRASVSDDETTYTYTDLPAGRYTTGPEDDSPNNVNLDGARWSNDNDGWDFRVRAGRTTTLRLQVIPESTGTVFVTLYDCPDGSDPSDSVDDCVISSDPWNAGISDIGQGSRDDWTLFDDAVAQVDGDWWFESLPATSLILFPAGFEPSGDFEVYVGGDAEFYPEDTWVIDLPPGGTAEIHLFRVYPESEPLPTEEPTNGGTGSLVITQYDCPYGTDIFVDDSPCELSTAPWEVTVANVETGETWSLLSDGIQHDSGTYYFEALPAGTYTISPRSNENWDLYYESTIEITDVNETYVTIYSVDRRAP